MNNGKFCFNCNRKNSGKAKYCSECGCELSNTVHDYVEIADVFFKFNDLKAFFKRYFKLLKNPANEIKTFFNQCTFSESLKFFEFGIGIYVLLYISKIMKFNENDLLNSLIIQLTLFASFLVSSYLFYLFCSFYSKEDKLLSQFLKLFLLIQGFLLPIGGVYLFAKNFISYELGSLISISILLPLLLFLLDVWSTFWSSLNRIILILAFALSSLVNYFLIAFSVRFLVN